MNLKIAFVFFTILLTASSLCAQNCFDRFVQAAEAAYAKLDFEKAINQFSAARECPDNTEKQIEEAEALIEKARSGYIEAIRQARDMALRAQKAAELQANISEANRLAFLANQERVNGNSQIALKLSFEAISLVENNPPLQVQQAFSDAVYAHSLRNLEGHSGSILSVQFSADGSRILSRSTDQTAIIWDQDFKPVGRIGQPECEIVSATFSPDGNLILAAFGNGTFVLTDSNGGSLLRIEAHQQGLLGAIFSSDGKNILTFARDNLVKRWDLKGNQLIEYSGHNARILDARFSPDGSMILSRSADKKVIFWNLEGNPLPGPSSPQAYIYSASFSQESNQILLAVAKPEATLWNIANQQNLVLNLSARGSRAIFSPDGEKVLTASSNGDLELWDIKGNSLGRVKAHTGAIEEIAFSADGNHILSLSADQTVSIHKLNFTLLASLDQHNGPVHSARFSPDGSMVLTASADKRVILWDLHGKLLASLDEHDKVLRQALFSPDGSIILSYGDGPIIQLSEVPDLVYKKLLEKPLPPLDEEEKIRFGIE